MNLLTKQKQTHSKQTHGYQRGKVTGKDKLGVWDWNIHTIVFKIDNQQGPIVGFPGGRVGKNPPASALDAGGVGSIPGLERPPGEGNGNPLQYSCLENTMNRGAWWARVSGITKELDTA